MKQLFVFAVFALAFPTLALAAAPNLEVAPPAITSDWGTGQTATSTTANLPTGSIMGIIMSTMNWLLAILGFIAIIGFVIAGILYLTAAGNETQIEKAKNAMTYSIIGVIVALIGYIIIQAVNLWLNTSTTF